MSVSERAFIHLASLHLDEGTFFYVLLNRAIMGRFRPIF
jgi:hypothetical protein